MAPGILLPSRGHSSGREGIQFLGNVLIKLIYLKKPGKGWEKKTGSCILSAESGISTPGQILPLQTKRFKEVFPIFFFFWEGFSEPGWNFSSKMREGGQNEPHVVPWGVTAPSPSLLRCVPPEPGSLPPWVSFAQS